MSVEMNAGDGIQIGVAIVLALTLGAVVWYACATHRLAEAAKRQAEASAEQAEASGQMAEQMEQARYDSLRPVIDIAPNEERAQALIKQALDKALPPEVECRLRNIGVGPALNVQLSRYDAQEQGAVPFKMGALGAGDSDARGHHLSLEGPAGGRGLRLVRVQYEDVFGRALESWRELSLNDEGELVIGPLRTLARGAT